MSKVDVVLNELRRIRTHLNRLGGTWDTKVDGLNKAIEIIEQQQSTIDHRQDTDQAEIDRLRKVMIEKNEALQDAWVSLAYYRSACGG